MKYALIENGVVTNTILLLPYNAHEFPNAISIEGLSVQAGDTYADGRFYRDGEPIYSMAEQMADMEAALALLGYPDSLTEVSTDEV